MEGQKNRGPACRLETARQAFKFAVCLREEQATAPETKTSLCMMSRKDGAKAGGPGFSCLTGTQGPIVRGQTVQERNKACCEAGHRYFPQLTDSKICDNLRQIGMKTYVFQGGSAFMELSLFEMSLIIVTLVSVLAGAFTLAWIDASPRKAAGEALDHRPD